MLAVGVEPASAMPHGVNALTASERRVAALAAAGRAEREIAQELFVTPRMIEIKLSKRAAQARRDLPGRARAGSRNIEDSPFMFAGNARGNVVQGRGNARRDGLPP